MRGGTGSRGITLIYKNSAVFDLETTGLDRQKDTILELAVLRIRNGYITGSYHELINPGRPIPPEITALTGITEEMTADCPPLRDVLLRFMTIIDRQTLLIGHNISFDLGFLDQKHRELWGVGIHHSFLDTRALCIKRFPYKSHKLEDVCKYLDIKHQGAHRAFQDVLATWEVAKRLWDEGAIADSNEGMAWYVNRILHYRKYAHDQPFVPEHGRLELIS